MDKNIMSIQCLKVELSKGLSELVELFVWININCIYDIKKSWETAFSSQGNH